MPKRTDEEIWNALEAQASDDREEDLKEVSLLTAEERARELKAAGFDRDEVRAQARAIREKVRGNLPVRVPGPVPVPMPMPVPRTRWTVPLTAASIGALVAALVGGGVAVVAFNQRSEHVRVSASPAKAAATLRKHALEACEKREWAQCAKLLDEAKGLDPEGDQAKSVQDARDAAEHGLHP